MPTNPRKSPPPTTVDQVQRNLDAHREELRAVVNEMEQAVKDAEQRRADVEADSKAISCRDVHTFLPAGRSAAQAKAFDDLVDVLQRMERLRWIELEAAAKAEPVASTTGSTSPRLPSARTTGRRCSDCLENDGTRSSRNAKLRS
jgi:hypothetical protein